MLKKYLLITLITLFSILPLEGRLYFIHVPKTGGTTLRLLLESQLSVTEIYPLRNPKSVKRKVREELVSGHLPYAFCKQIDTNFDNAFKVTILRDPIERYLSFLRAKKKAYVEFPDLESVFESQRNGKFHFPNLMDNGLCRFLTSNPRLKGKALLESAKQSLHKFDCVIFFDAYVKETKNLFKRLGIDLKEIPKINATEPEPISEELLNKVKELNLLDIELFKYAKEQLHKKNSCYQLRTASFEQLLKKTNAINYTFDQPLNGKGWTYRDGKNPIYRWVMNYPAYIYFPLEQESDYILKFWAWPLTDEVIPKVNINGKEIDLVRQDQKPFSLYQGTIPKSYITSQPTEVTFYSPKAFYYRDVYPRDHNRNHPPLSFAISRIQIIPIGSK